MTAEPTVLLDHTSADRVPDAEFTRKLRELDPWLVVDWHVPTRRWLIRRKVYGVVDERSGLQVCGESLVHVWTVRNPDGSFHDLDQWVIDQLKAADSWNVDIEARMRAFDAYQEAERRRANERRWDDMAHAVAENRVSINRSRSRESRGLAGGKITDIHGCIREVDE